MKNSKGCGMKWFADGLRETTVTFSQDSLSPSQVSNLGPAEYKEVLTTWLHQHMSTHNFNPITLHILHLVSNPASLGPSTVLFSHVFCLSVLIPETF